MKFSFKLKKTEAALNGDNRVWLRKETALDCGLFAGDRLLIKADKKQKEVILALGDDFPVRGCLGVAETLIGNLRLRGKVNVLPVAKPMSLRSIDKKLSGESLTAVEIEAVVADSLGQKWTTEERTVFLASLMMKDLTPVELVHLTRSLLNSGPVLERIGKKVMGTASLFEMPGNAFSLIVSSILVAAGFKTPQIGERAVKAPTGVIDVLETVSVVNRPWADLSFLAKSLGGFVVWGGGLGAVPAGDVFLAERSDFGRCPLSLILADLVVKQAMMGVNVAVVDLPFGPAHGLTNKRQAKQLARRLSKLGAAFKIKFQVLLSDGSQPVGAAIGPVLEMLEILRILKNEVDASPYLREKALQIAGLLIDMSGRFWWRKGYNIARQILNSGKAHENFQKLVDSQGAKKKALRPAAEVWDWRADRAGRIGFDVKEVNLLARTLGVPAESGAGIFLHGRAGQKVKAGDKILTFYAADRMRLAAAKDLLRRGQGVTLA